MGRTPPSHPVWRRTENGMDLCRIRPFATPPAEATAAFPRAEARTQSQPPDQNTCQSGGAQPTVGGLSGSEAATGLRTMAANRPVFARVRQFRGVDTELQTFNEYSRDRQVILSKPTHKRKGMILNVFQSSGCNDLQIGIYIFNW